MIFRTLQEWKTINCGDTPDEIPTWAADRIAAVASKSKLAKRSGAGVLEHGRKGLTAKGVVGVIAAADCMLEILPKIDFPGEGDLHLNRSIRRRLVHMLAVVLDLNIDAGRLTKLDSQNDTLLELLIRLFSVKLADTLRQGTPRRYVEQSDDLPALRGRLNMVRQFSRLSVSPARLACYFDELTADVPLNQVMKAAVTRLASASRNIENQRRLRELAFAYADITDVPVSALRWDAIVLDRTNSSWLELLSIARMLLGDQSQTTSAGEETGFSLLFDMSALFEEYIARMLRRALIDTDIRVISQGGLLYCLSSDGKDLFQTRPDILLKRQNKTMQIIDTKWKLIAAHNDQPKQGISQADIYQVMAYGQLYDCDRLTLLYPHNAELGGIDGVRVEYKINNSERLLQTCTLDISNDQLILERLRSLVYFKEHAKPFRNSEGRDR
jgi:5-methylcytosine-specific restriction enzyme subunit McrC